LTHLLILLAALDPVPIRAVDACGDEVHVLSTSVDLADGACLRRVGRGLVSYDGRWVLVRGCA
jgi:hypothetical protein